MNIGNTIKKLRKGCKITQEKFAEYLGVTPQAVSRWENGSAYPDISMLPMIAEFFGVSSDYLLGIEVDKREEQVEEVIAEYKRLSASGEKMKRFEFVKEAAFKHPGELRILILYAEELLASPYNGINGNTDMTQEEIHEINSDVIYMCERILEDCTRDDVRYRALNLMSQAYMEEGDLKKSEKYARMLPDWWNSSNMTLYRIMDSDSIEHTIFRQENISDLANLLWLWIRSEVWVNNTVNDKIILCKKALSIYQILYENGDYGYANELVGQIWQNLGDAYLEIDDKESAIDAVEKMVYHKLQMDKIDGMKHTSILFNKLVFSQNELTRNFSCSNREIALGWLIEQKKYDCIRSDARFQDLVHSLNI